MKWPWKRAAKPARILSPKRMELETAKEILAEVFHARREDVEEMIQRRLEERCPAAESLSEEGRWPANFSLVSSHGPEL